MGTVGELFDQALRYHQAGDLAQAEPLYRQILQADPRHADALHLLGFLHHQAGASDSAIPLIRQAIALNPACAVYYSNLGVVYLETGHPERAVDSYRLATRFNPRFADAHANLAGALKDLGRYAEAADSCRAALRLNPRHAQAHNILGNVLRDEGQPEAAVAHYEQALQSNPRCFHTLGNMGLALKDLGRLDEAIAYCRQSLAINPRHAPAHNNLATALAIRGEIDLAMASFAEALRIKPDYASARWNWSILKLLQGDFAAGWPAYEARWQLRGFTDAHPEKPLWDGSALDGKTILLYAEQGLGDTIQFVRYARLVQERGGRVIFECPPALAPLLRELAGVNELVSARSPLPAFDVRAPLLSLPGIFGTSLESIPASVPYLRAEAHLVDKWNEELSALNGFKIAISWQGSPTHEADRWRSIPLAAFAPLADLAGVRLINVQKGPGTEQLARTPRVSGNLLDLSPRLDLTGAFLDTAAVLMNVDLVVTVDSAVAHLAGALGVPVWLAAPLVPDWRWLLGRSDSPWYPSMRIFRQTKLGEWGDVFGRIADEIRARL